MSAEDRVAKMKKIEYASPEELTELIKFDYSEVLENGTVTNHYIVPDGHRPPGFLWIQFNPKTLEVIAAEMDINFDSLIGLNKSPIQLRLLCNHVLANLAYEKTP